jgi:hypothetical protein
MLALVLVGSGLVYAYHRWTRLSKERVLDQRLARPDPFHDPAAKEPPRRPAGEAGAPRCSAVRG